MSEWLTARKPIEARISSAQRQMSRATDTDALNGFIGNSSALRAQWPDLPLARQNAIVRAILEHAVIGPGKPRTRGVDPSRVSPGLETLTTPGQPGGWGDPASPAAAYASCVLSPTCVQEHHHRPDDPHIGPFQR